VTVPAATRTALGRLAPVSLLIGIVMENGQARCPAA